MKNRLRGCICSEIYILSVSHTQTDKPTPPRRPSLSPSLPPACLQNMVTAAWMEENFSDMYKMQMHVFEEILKKKDTHTQTHNPQPHQLVCGREVSHTTQRTQMWGDAKANTLYTSKAFLGGLTRLISHNKHMSDHIPLNWFLCIKKKGLWWVCLSCEWIKSWYFDF